MSWIFLFAGRSEIARTFHCRSGTSVYTSCAYFTPRMARKAIYRQESCAFYINLRQADTHWGPWHTPHWIGTVRSAFPRQTGQTR